jgi:CheY-like chemotaxis protein
VLVVDDDADVREVVVAMLESLGYEAESVADGALAIDAFAKANAMGRPFAAVLMDLTIPGGMGGKEAVVRLRELDPDVRAIVSSGYSNDPVMSDYTRYGFSDIVAKPYDLARLGETLRRVLERKGG